MIFKESSDKIFLSVRLYLKYIIHYVYLLFYTKYYSVNSGKSYRIDIMKLPKAVNMSCFVNDERIKAKRVGSKDRYFFLRKNKNEIVISVDEHHTCFHEKHIPRYPINHMGLFLITICSGIIPVYLVTFLPRFLSPEIASAITNLFNIKKQ